MTWNDTTVIIPTLNEGKNIGKLLHLLMRQYPGMQVIVADDGSRDGTQETVKKSRARLLDRTEAAEHGLTASVLDGALLAKTRFLVVIDGDMQHPPEKIREIVEKLRHGNDVVIGSRRRVLIPWPWHRRLMSATATQLARLRLGRYVRDPLSGFFGVQKELFTAAIKQQRHRFAGTGYKVLFDFLKCSGRLQIAEVAYDFGQRGGGESKIRSRHVRVFLRSLLR